MNSCDYIRDGKCNSPINRIFHRQGKDHHKSHEVLSDTIRGSPNSPQKCKEEKIAHTVDRKDKNKRNSRSEDNLLGIVQKLVSASPSGQLLLTQDFFTVSVVVLYDYEG